SRNAAEYTTRPWCAPGSTHSTVRTFEPKWISSPLVHCMTRNSRIESLPDSVHCQWGPDMMPVKTASIDGLGEVQDLLIPKQEDSYGQGCEIRPSKWARRVQVRTRVGSIRRHPACAWPLTFSDPGSTSSNAGAA